MKLLFYPFITKSVTMHSSFNRAAPPTLFRIDSAHDIMTIVANTKHIYYD